MNKITVAFLNSEITDVEYKRLGGTLTHCTIKTKCGFSFTGESACVDEKEFNEKTGQEIAYKNAFESMWQPYGLWLAKQIDSKQMKPTPTENLNFGQALNAIKNGQKVARKGWNGKNMFAAMSCDGSREVEAKDLWSPHNAEFAHQNGGTATVVPSCTLKTAQDTIVMGWQPNALDLFAEDWQVL